MNDKGRLPVTQVNRSSRTNSLADRLALAMGQDGEVVEYEFIASKYSTTTRWTFSGLLLDCKVRRIKLSIFLMHRVQFLILPADNKGPAGKRRILLPPCVNMPHRRREIWSRNNAHFNGASPCEVWRLFRTMRAAKVIS